MCFCKDLKLHVHDCAYIECGIFSGWVKICNGSIPRGWPSSLFCYIHVCGSVYYRIRKKFLW